jgi:putative ABC transport system permease protein
VSQAWQRAITDDFNRRHFDLSVRLASPVAVATLEQALSKLPAVKHAEYWPQASPYLIGPSGVPGNLVALLGVDPTSTLLDLRRLGGRWLQSGDSNAAVINNAVLVRHPGLGIGDTVRVRLEGRTLGFPIAGIVKEMSPMPVIYAPAATVRAASGQSSETARSIRIVTADHSEAGQLAAAREIEQSFEEREIEISGLQRMLDLRKGILDHLVIIQTILTMAATLVVFVGSLGLASTLSIGVIQRTREIGVMGAIGATPGTIARQVWIESIVLGFLSWLLSLALAAPVSFVLESVTGQMFFKAPLEFFLSPAAAALWLALVLVLATLSSWAPARRAARLSVRDAIAHT